MKSIKLIFSDLDRTLLRDDKTLSPYTRQVLAACRERGIKFFPTTARPPRALENWIDGLSYDGAVCHNGGVAVLGDKIIWENGIDPQVTAALLGELCKNFPEKKISAEIAGRLYANFDARDIWPGIVYTPSEFDGLPDLPSEKILVEITDPEDVRAYTALLPAELKLTVSDGTLAMIQPRGIEKGKAVRSICERLGVSPTDTVGFGDDLNDISLLLTCGQGVAVENALPQVKAAASALCGSNEEDGPARWLEEHIL